MSNYLDSSSPIVLAHRGGAVEVGAADNSLVAFQHAVAVGCKYLETDVRMGEDGRLYLWHDASSKIPNRPLKLDDKAPYLTPEELFLTFPNCYFAIDPKDTLSVEPLANLIITHGLQYQVCLGASFDARARRVADIVESRSGKRPFTALVSGNASLELLTNPWALQRRKRAYKASFIHVHRKLISPVAINNAHKQGLKIIAWVANRPETMQKFLSWGIDGFMTDYPGRTRNFSVR